MSERTAVMVRAAQIEDAEGIVAMWNPIIESGLYTSFDTPITVEAEREYIKNMTNRHIFHVAEIDGRIVGLQSTAPFPAYTSAFDHVSLISTFVDLNYHRRGISKALFSETFIVAREKGFEKFFTYVRADNIKGLSTYLSQGFTIVGTAHKQAKIQGEYIDEVIIEKLL